MADAKLNPWDPDEMLQNEEFNQGLYGLLAK